MTLSEGEYGLVNAASKKKQLVYVKLTDSALRAIEEFLEKGNSFNEGPTLRFLGNDGKISIPSKSGSCDSFDFSLSDNTDVEPGSFECIQDLGRGQGLQSLGSIPYKLRIQANDDVYEATKKRMHAVNEERKNECVKEIENDFSKKKSKTKNYSSFANGPGSNAHRSSHGTNAHMKLHHKNTPIPTTVRKGLGSNPSGSTKREHPDQNPEMGISPIPKKQRISHMSKPNEGKSPDSSSLSSPGGATSSPDPVAPSDDRNPSWVAFDAEWEAELNKIEFGGACDDFQENYTTITNAEQRSAYKRDFNSEYNIYRDLHAVIEKVSKKFALLEDRLAAEEKGSEAYEVISNEIVVEYNVNKNNARYQGAKAKFNHLHLKLSHIKSLVNEYDSNNTSFEA